MYQDMSEFAFEQILKYWQALINSNDFISLFYVCFLLN